MKADWIGSPSRDIYRKIHKDRKNYSSDYAHMKCHACDIDLVEVRNGRIVGFTDFKLKGIDTISHTEKIVYNILGKIAPVFIVYSIDADLNEFEVYSYPDETLIGAYQTREQYFHEFIEKLGIPKLDESGDIPPMINGAVIDDSVDRRQLLKDECYSELFFDRRMEYWRKHPEMKAAFDARYEEAQTSE